MKPTHFSALVATFLSVSCSGSSASGTYTFPLEQGAMQVSFVTPDIVRVQYSADGSFSDNGTIACVGRDAAKMKLHKKVKSDGVHLVSDSLAVVVNPSDGTVSFQDRAGRVLLRSNGKDSYHAEKIWLVDTEYDPATRRVEKTADGEKTVMDVLRQDTIGQAWKYEAQFQLNDDEAMYGLGSHMEDYLNLRGKRMGLIQHNLKAVVPMLTSTAGYGLLFDAGCGMVYDDTHEAMTMQLEAAQTLDYYFMKGANLDRTVAQYRYLTGDVPMQPRYLFGYIQSKERYVDAAELQGVVERYRRNHLPLDVIVQDWMYWPSGWGYIHLDPNRYPDAKALADTIHKMNTHLMVSIWPNPSYCPEADDFKNHGWYLGGTAYDAYNADARKLYWQYANETFFRHGFDAWWCDCTEPVDADWHKMPEGYGWDSHDERYESSNTALSRLLGAERANTFSLFHSAGIYENQRATTSQKRVVNLTRSSFAGQQRFATITWNGDTHASWKGFARMIPAGLNFMATGCNYWTVDAGAFFTISNPTWFYGGSFGWNKDNRGYHEFYLRMLQYAQFLPLFRSHGTNIPREVWNFGQPGDPIYDAIINCINRRYQLLPYTYSLAHEVSFHNYTMSRLLAFDFASDARVLDLKDEFMYGPSLLIHPIVEPMYFDEQGKPLNQADRRCTTYLPQGASWFDYWTGAAYSGGTEVTTEVSLDHIPVFVRAGSILPMGPVVEYAEQQSSLPLEIHVYPGADAVFQLYDDAGDGYDYEQGAYSIVGLHWNDASRVLTFDARQGSFPNMQPTRPFTVVLHEPGNSMKQQTIIYQGTELSVSL